jgi:hypothetical protein
VRPAKANSSRDLPISKINRGKWIGDVAKVVECLICKCEVLSSNFSQPPTKNAIYIIMNILYLKNGSDENKIYQPVFVGHCSRTINSKNVYNNSYIKNLIECFSILKQS